LWKCHRREKKRGAGGEEGGKKEEDVSLMLGDIYRAVLGKLTVYPGMV
jgi:hypothetical protein